MLIGKPEIFKGIDIDSPVNLSKLLNEGYKKDPDGVALASVDEEYSWSQLELLTNNLASNYLSLGLQPGDRVASFMPNSPELFIHYIACFKAGLVSVPLNYRYARNEIKQALEVADIHYIVLDCGVSVEIKELLAGAEDVQIIWNKPQNADSASLVDLLEPPKSQVPLPDIDEDSPCGIYFTSGTTGNPKGITHTRKSLGYVLKSMIVGFDIVADDTVLPATHFSTYLSTLASLSQGAKVLVASLLEDSKIIPLLRKYRATIFGMLPAGLSNLLNSPLLQQSDFQNLRLCLTGGDKVPTRLTDEFRRLIGLELLEGYGLSECGISHNNPIYGVNVIGSVGTVMPGFECSIRKDGVELDPGEVGELWIKSQSNMVGYWRNKGASDEILVDGWMRTGDLMRVDEDGYYWFMGREKQLIVSGGSNICPQEVEEVLMQHPSIDMAGVIGVADPVYGQLVHVYVTMRLGEEKITKEDVIEYCRKNLAKHKLPNKVIILDTMPITAAGKVDRVVLGKMNNP